MQFETIVYEKRDRVVSVTLNRPQRLNAINPLMERELRQAWAAYKEDDEAWVAIVTGTGDKAFCAGADLKELAQRIEAGQHITGQFETGARVRRMEEGFRPSPAMNDVWKPVIAAVNGVCAGGGLHFMAECDFAIASENATFVDPHVSFGLVSAVETVGLTRRMPPSAVLRMAMMGKHERLTAQRAYELGLVTELTTAEQLMPRAFEIAAAIAENAPFAVRQTKKALAGGLEMTLRDALQMAWYVVEETNTSVDAQEGPRAFAEGKKPEWRLR